MELKKQLEEKNFKFKHSLGQNFLQDENLLRAITNDADICKGDNVLEIGAGAGTLTKQLCLKNPKKVVAVEVDKTLEPFLRQNLKFENLELKFEDILKIKPNEIKNWFWGEPFKVVANLPYYISTPIMFFLLENEFNLESFTVMLQLELAQRLCAKPGTKDYGAITILLEFLGTTTLKRKVSKAMFVPMPKVDSAIVHFVLEPNKFDLSFKIFSEFVKNCFAMRRKTLQNNLAQFLDLTKQEILDKLKVCGYDEKTRAETLCCEEFVKLCKVFLKNIQKK